MTTSDNISVANRWFQEVWNEGKNETIYELLASDAVLKGADRADIHGPEEFEKFAEGIRAAFPDIKIFVEDAFAHDDKVAIRWYATMTHKGGIAGIPATDNTVRITGLSIGQIKNGKFVASWDNWDRLAMLEQIGALQASPAAPQTTAA
jgi:steroid delta-isomerase-like uncharacterized protein